MKKIKKLGIMAVSVALLTAALAVPASATSVSGSIGGYSCSGSNSITASSAHANTHCSGNTTLGVELTYNYTIKNGSKMETEYNQNSNSPVRDISTSCTAKNGGRSSNCHSVHRVVHNGIWQQKTAVQYY